MTEEKWYESSDAGVFARGARKLTFKWVAIALLVAAVVAGGVYAITYATADSRGRIALHNQQRTADQLQASYEYFHEACHNIITEGQQITTLEAQYKNDVAHPPVNDPFGQNASRLSQEEQDLTGLKNVRDADAQTYDARSHEFTHNFMKSHDLPLEIGPPNGTPYEGLVCEGAN